MRKKRLVVLLSGRGSNFEAIARNCASGKLKAEIAAVISNKPDAAGLATAKAMGLTAIAIPSKGLSRQEHDRQLADAIKQYSPDLICLAGYMRLLTPEFVNLFAGRILNIHPSLLPSFAGLDAPKQALDYGVKVSGCTVHFVTAEMDAGPIILQAAVPVLPGDTVDSLSRRILEQEHRIYSEAIKQVLSNET
jgi:phosphoribosylglycinamide formyltransferase-1